MAYWQLTDEERCALVAVAVDALAGHRTMLPAALLTGLAKISGTDTVVLARREYPPTVGDEPPTDIPL